MSFIEIESVSKYFGSHHALNEITLSIDKGEFVTFLGPSGCGKTTTLRLIAGFLQPDSGEVRLEGKVLSSAKFTIPPEERRMGMVFQNYAVWPHMSIYENVAFGLNRARIGKQAVASRVEAMLDTVGLSGMGGRHPGQLSGGQQQRVALARSLVVEPSILLLDEPLSNLDAKLREHMRGELKALQRRTGITFLYVTHDQTEALSLSDKVIVFQNGSVQQVGTPQEVYNRPANLFVADFMGALNKLEGRIVGREGTRLRVRSGNVEFQAVRSGDYADDGRTTLAIRPEAIVLDTPEDNPNTYVCRIADVVFLGSAIEYTLDIQGSQLKALGSPAKPHVPGSIIKVEIPPQACMAMAS